ncbi:MAG: hypothetical protein KDB01_01045 [Planctomycetaceae bacterium]|nr:hypothetical protein [Planctomycetaceae bacterium]
MFLFNDSQRLPQLHTDERGMMTFANCVCVLLSALLFTATINNSHIANRKIERQNAADAVAQSAGVWMARGMNSITATNHLMGEMLSMVILHEAVGGKKQENSTSADEGTNKSKKAEDPQKLKRQDNLLKLAYQIADGIAKSGIIKAPDKDVYEMVYQRSGGQSQIMAEATLLDSKMNLKVWLTRAYQGLAAAAVLKAIPYTRAAGEALEQAMLLLEMKVAQEYRTLKALHGIVDQLLPVKKLLRDQMLPFAKKYTTDVTRLTPEIARATAIEIGEMNGVTADLFPTPGMLRLPIKIDPLAISHSLPTPDTKVPEPDPDGCGCPSETTAVTWDQVSKMTQLARATFPWVNYHRKPVLDGLAATCQLAEAKDFYFHWSNGYSKMIIQEQQQPEGNDPNSHLGLYVLEGYEGPDKGYERWNIAEYSTLADDYFTIIGLAHQKPPFVIGRPIFNQEHSDGMLAYSMALLYNGNEQERPEHRIDPTCKRLVPIRQANVGMDTLNWYPGSRQKESGCELRPAGSQNGENRPFELLGIGLPADYPRIQINWQSKLVPATGHRLSQLKQAALRGEMESVSERLLDVVPRSLTTH